LIYKTSELSTTPLRQCQINYGSGGTRASELGRPHNFTEIIFIHTKYIKKHTW